MASKYKLGVTTGLHYVGRETELATTVKKLGFGLTRGTRAIEIASDVPHEITETEGKVLRKIAHKQGVDILLHGSLTIPMCIPERSDWRDAHDHIQKSIRSAVRAGAKYVDFHACLNIWLELMTYTSRKLTMSFVDHLGHFISVILQESPKLRKWFIKHRGDDYYRDVLTSKENIDWQSEASIKYDNWHKDEIQSRLSREGIEQRIIDAALQLGRFPEIGLSEGEANRMFTQFIREGKSEAEASELVAKEAERRKRLQDLGRKIIDDINKESIPIRSRIQNDELNKALERKLSAGEPWESEELRAVVGILDGYHIMAHYMFYKRDPMWTEMVKIYPIVRDKYKIDYNDDEWLYNTWREAEKKNDREFKEFFYGVVGAKFLEGHIRAAFEWRDETLIPKELAGQPQLQQYARDLILAIESPDARDPQHAGLHLLWSTRQIYVAVKVIRQELKTDRVWMLADFEHVATQGLDPIVDMDEVVKFAPDIGSYVISTHANAPNPMHAHEPLELGDTRVYRLLHYLRQTGFGKNNDVYVIYERGGGEDPFMRAVETLRLIIKFLEQDVHPDRLPAEFFGYEGAVAGGETRQRQIVRDHAWEPLKDLLEIPEEEFTMLSTAVTKKGKRPEQWKKGEFR